MSDAAVANLITGAVTITTLVVGFLTLWVKLRYGVKKAEEVSVKAESVENKIDHNTILTQEAKDAANKASDHTSLCDVERKEMLSAMRDHEARISSIEGQMAMIKGSVDSVQKDLTSTRHEIRGNLQTITNMLATAAYKDEKK